MNTSKAQRVVIISTTFVILVGTINSIAKNGRWPGHRFWFGTGFMAIGLSLFAEWEPEVASPLSIAVLTTVLLGEGDGVLSYIATRGEIDTQKRTPKNPQELNPAEVERREAQASAPVPLGEVGRRPNLAGTQLSLEHYTQFAS